MTQFYKLILLSFFFLFSKSYAVDAVNSSSTNELLKAVKIDEEKLRQSISTWDELKDREYNLAEFGLLDNDKSRVFIKAFMAKIKYIKRNLQDPAFLKTLPSNTTTQKIDEGQIIQTTKKEVLLLLGFAESDVLPPVFVKTSIFNTGK